MAEKKKRARSFRSMIEIEKEYFPKAFKRESAARRVDPQILGAALAQQSLSKIIGRSRR